MGVRILILVLFFFTSARAQVTPDLELLDETDPEAIAELNRKQEELLIHKADLNNEADRAELQAAGLITNEQLNAIEDHIILTGEFLNTYELQTVPGFDTTFTRTLLSYVRISPKRFSVDQVLNANLKQKLFLRSAIDYKDVDASSLRMTYRGNAGPISWGFQMESDKNEGFDLKVKSLPFDHNTGFIYFRNVGRVTQLALGDYQVSFGQGLNVWTNFGSGRSLELFSMKRIASGIKPNTGSDENWFLRGVATSVGAGDFLVTGFFSSNRIDARLSPDRDSIELLLNTGIHLTESELDSRKSSSLSAFGADISYKKKRKSVGIAFTSTSFGKPVAKHKQLSKLNQFHADQNKTVSVHYDASFLNLNAFGEAAYSLNNSIAVVNGLLVSLHKDLTACIQTRLIGRNYNSYYSNIVAESTKANDEQGMFIGIQNKLSSNFTVAGYFDQFTSTWIRSTVTGLNLGTSARIRFCYQQKDRTKLELLIAQRTGLSNVDSEPIDVPGEKVSKDIRINMEYVWKRVTLSTRLQTRSVKLRETDNYSFLLTQMFNLSIGNRSQLSIAFTLADVSSSVATIYSLNDELPGFSGLKGYSKDSKELMVIGKTKMSKYVSIGLKSTFSSTIAPSTNLMVMLSK